MKNILPFAVLLLFIFCSCKKQNPNENPYGPLNSISATVDGVNTSFNFEAAAVTLAGGNPTLIISGLTSAGGTRALINIVVASNNSHTMTVGSYVSINPTNNAGSVSLQYAYITSGSQNGVNYVTVLNNNSTATISSISSTNVQGTFSGKLTITTGDTTTRSITNGKFNVTISN